MTTTYFALLSLMIIFTPARIHKEFLLSNWSFVVKNRVVSVWYPTKHTFYYFPILTHYYSSGFQLGPVFSRNDTLAMSANIFGCHKGGELLGI